MFYFLIFLIGEKLLYNFVLVSALQQCKSVIIVDTYTRPSLPSPHSTPLGHQRVLGWTPVLFSNFPIAMHFTHDSAYRSMLLSQLSLLSYLGVPESVSSYSALVQVQPWSPVGCPHTPRGYPPPVDRAHGLMPDSSDEIWGPTVSSPSENLLEFRLSGPNPRPMEPEFAF